jgi:hypothetical protein
MDRFTVWAKPSVLVTVTVVLTTAFIPALIVVGLSAIVNPCAYAGLAKEATLSKRIRTINQRDSLGKSIPPFIRQGYRI